MYHLKNNVNDEKDDSSLSCNSSLHFKQRCIIASCRPTDKLATGNVITRWSVADFLAIETLSNSSICLINCAVCRMGATNKR